MGGMCWKIRPVRIERFAESGILPSTTTTRLMIMALVMNMVVYATAEAFLGHLLSPDRVNTPAFHRFALYSQFHFPCILLQSFPAPYFHLNRCLFLHPQSSFPLCPQLLVCKMSTLLDRQHMLPLLSSPNSFATALFKMFSWYLLIENSATGFCSSVV